MNIDFNEYYDQEDDVYYVTFCTNEPSRVVEVDDVLLWEIGVFTNMPTGFRILNYSKNKIARVAVMVKEAEKMFEEGKRKLQSDLDCRESRIEEMLGKVLEPA